MDARERLLVARLTNAIAGLPDVPKDADAEREVAMLLRVRPDAPYLLLQRCLMAEVALAQAQEEFEALRAGARRGNEAGYGAAAAPGGGSSSLLSRAGNALSGRPAAAPGGYAAGAAPGGYGAPTAAAPSGPFAAAPSAGGSFLRNAAAVGAGVIGGSLLFQGIGSLMQGGGDRAAEAGNGFLSGGNASTTEPGETTSNFSGTPSPDTTAAADDGTFDPSGADVAADDGGGDDWA